MTRLPLETRDVKPMSGDHYPRYKVLPICSHPLCSRPATEKHHIWRRSFLGGDYWWVQFVDPETGVVETVGNIAGLCNQHHAEITVNIHEIVWWKDGAFWWRDGELGLVAPLAPQPPRHGHQQVEPVTSHKHIAGPASADTCGTCGQRIRKANTSNAEKKEELRKRKSWVIRVPDDGEDGALVLDTLVDGCADLFGHEHKPAMRFFTIVQALALVLQNEQFLVDSE